jgi:hypothetical protein
MKRHSGLGRSLAIIVALAAFAGGCQAGDATPSAPAPTVASPSATAAPATPTPTATPAPTPTPTPVAGAWKQVPASATLKKIQFYAVEWAGSRFAAAGTLMDGSAVFLDSADGLAWHLQPAVWKGATVRGLAVGAAGLIAVGDLDGRMVVWTSADGLAWTRAADLPAMHPSKGAALRVDGVASVGGGWMAVGTEYSAACYALCAPLGAVVWTSPDGLSWTRIPASTALASAAMTDVVLWHGTYVAVGRAGKSAAVWTSTDGTTWTRVPDIAAFHTPKGTDSSIGASMASVAGGSDRLVAVGQVLSSGDTISALAWSSGDAATWTAAAGEKFISGQMFAVAAVPTGYLAVGPSGAPSCLGGIWSSPDGAAWKCEASAKAFKGFIPNSVGASPTLEIALGFADGGATGAAWYRELTAP